MTNSIYIIMYDWYSVVCSQAECDDTSPSSGSDQYWAVAPPTVYTAIDTANSPTAGAGSYYSPMFFQVC